MVVAASPAVHQWPYFSVEPLLFSEIDAEETTVVLTNAADVKGMTGRGNGTLRSLYFI